MQAQRGEQKEHEAQGQAERPAQSYIVMALIVVSAGIISSLIQNKVPSILPELSARFGMDAYSGSMMMSVFTLMGIFFSIPSHEGTKYNKEN